MVVSVLSEEAVAVEILILCSSNNNTLLPAYYHLLQMRINYMLLIFK